METRLNRINTLSFQSSYPTYEEWKLLYYMYFVKRFMVLILPMRNGNKVSFNPNDELDLRSYPTYEEWKLLPSEFKVSEAPVTFLSYL